MSWLKTKSDKKAELNSTKFWENLSSDLANGIFWADRIKEFKVAPDNRLTLALENLPLPGAFREAIIALRAIIREKRKSKENYDKELFFLYWLAAIDSFSIPYSTYLQQPSFNVIESILGQVIQSLPFTYDDLGYTKSKLKLLNKTDAKWCVEAWGEPDQHKTMYELHHDIWQKYERKLKVKQKKRLEQLLSGL